MNPAFEDKRKSDRFGTDVKVYFHYPYDLQTKVDYQLTEKNRHTPLPPKYSGVSRNVSVEGLCFHSEKELHGGDNLLLELHLPGSQTSVFMEGTVRWCHSAEKEQGFDTGVRLLTVDGTSVPETIYFDETYHIEWSAVLETILGKFRKLSQKQKSQ